MQLEIICGSNRLIVAKKLKDKGHKILEFRKEIPKDIRRALDISAPKEIDIITDKYIIECKSGKVMLKDIETRAKSLMKYAKHTNRKLLYVFSSDPPRDVIDLLKREGISYMIIK